MSDLSLLETLPELKHWMDKGSPYPLVELRQAEYWWESREVSLHGGIEVLAVFDSLMSRSDVAILMNEHVSFDEEGFIFPIGFAEPLDLPEFLTQHYSFECALECVLHWKEDSDTPTIYDRYELGNKDLIDLLTKPYHV